MKLTQLAFTVNLVAAALLVLMLLFICLQGVVSVFRGHEGVDWSIWLFFFVSGAYLGLNLLALRE